MMGAGKAAILGQLIPATWTPQGLRFDPPCSLAEKAAAQTAFPSRDSDNLTGTPGWVVRDPGPWRCTDVTPHTAREAESA